MNAGRMRLVILLIPLLIVAAAFAEETPPLSIDLKQVTVVLLTGLVDLLTEDELRFVTFDPGSEKRNLPAIAADCWSCKTLK